jgi:hypothetical protein
MMQGREGKITGYKTLNRGEGMATVHKWRRHRNGNKKEGRTYTHRCKEVGRGDDRCFWKIYFINSISLVK